jgi:hypothetical protein
VTGTEFLDRPVGFKRYYDPLTSQFLSVDPAVGMTGTPYAYAGDDPVNNTDPSGDCTSLFNLVCVGGGSVGTTISLRFDPGAAANATVNIGRGASFGLSDTIANWLSPGASCTVPQNGVDQFIGGAATAVTGGELLGGLFAGGGGSVDGLLSSGAELDPADAGGQLTRAGRAYAKASEVFGPTSGGPAAINDAGQSALEEILTNPATTVVKTPAGRFAGGLTFISPDGVGVVYGPDGTLQYFGRMSP